MMELTTRIGTAKAAFHDRHGHRYLPVDVAGKTGTLSAQTDKGYLGYSWFIGYAPGRSPQHRVCRRAGQPAAVAHQGDLRGEAHRRRAPGEQRRAGRARR